MPATLSSAAPQTLKDYYRILESGIDSYQDGADLRPLLGDHLDFTGSLAGHLPDATDGFLGGVAGFIATVKQIEIIHDVHSPNGSAVLYTATMPGGPIPDSLQVFGWSENGDALLWDTASRGADGEFPVWESRSFNSLHRLGGSFHEALPSIRTRAMGLFGPRTSDIEPLQPTAL